MVAYSFQPQFELPIRSGRKAQTIRRVGGKRQARPGEAVQLFIRQRSPGGFRLGGGTCTACEPLILDTLYETVRIGAAGPAQIVHATWPHLDAFARDDGFDDWPDMLKFWRIQHPGVERFEGVIVQWRDFQPVASP